MRKILTTLSALIAFSNIAYGYTKPKPGDKTSDVIKYARTHTEFPEQGFNQFNCDQCSTLKNGIFVTTVTSCGTGACDYLIFEKNGAELTFKSLVDLKPGAFQFLKTTHHGLPDIKYYHHMSADDGLIRTLEFDGRIYKDAAPQKKVAAVDFEKEITPENVKVSVVK